MTEQFKQNLGRKPELKWVPVDKINVDHNYQRDLRKHRLTKILQEFDWSQFQPVMLAEQEDGTFNVFDGQHRVAAARLHPEIDEVPAAVLQLDDLQKEAAAFIGVNVNRTAVTTIEKYWAGLEANDPDMMAVRDVLAGAGCEVVLVQGAVGSNRTHAVSAVSRAIKLYGPEATRKACQSIRDAWPTDKQALKGIVITALSRVFRRNADINAERVVSLLKELERDGLSSNAEAMRKISGGDAATSIAKTICELYNRGLRANHIQIGTKN